VSVPITTEDLITSAVTADKIAAFNSNEQYLLFQEKTESEQRFLLVSDKEDDEESIIKTQKGVFGNHIRVEKINDTTDGKETETRVQHVKKLMVNLGKDDGYEGIRTTLIVTETAKQLEAKANEIIGFSQYKEFFRNLNSYIDRTSNIQAKNLYNIVIVNKCNANLDAQVELLYKLFAVKGLLEEQAVIKGDFWDARHTNRETKLLYHIDDDWYGNKDEDFWQSSSEYNDESSDKIYQTDSREMRLLNKIMTSSNIYITSITPAVYKKLKELETFEMVFPNVVFVEELTVDEKIELIIKITEEYGFTFNSNKTAQSRFIKTASASEVEMSVRKTVMKKLIDGCDFFCLELSDFAPKKKQKKKKSAFDELEKLIGLEGVKKTIREITTFLQRRGKSAVPCIHMAFLGSPGTGKTTVARIIGRIFYEIGLLKKEVFVETDRSGLIAEYVGQTTIKTKKMVESALGGVLFIDEAYSLLMPGNTDEEGCDYGHEALSTLVKLMEDKRDELVCIFAGYTKEMERMISMNPGLRDRIQFHINFPDFTAEELMAIFKKMCTENKYVLSSCAEIAIKDKFTKVLRTASENFANGRLVRKVFERIRIKQALRTLDSNITEADVQAVFTEGDLSKLLTGNNISQIGFISYIESA